VWHKAADEILDTLAAYGARISDSTMRTAGNVAALIVGAAPPPVTMPVEAVAARSRHSPVQGEKHDCDCDRRDEHGPQPPTVGSFFDSRYSCCAERARSLGRQYGTRTSGTREPRDQPPHQRRRIPTEASALASRWLGAPPRASDHRKAAQERLQTARLSRVGTQDAARLMRERAMLQRGQDHCTGQLPHHRMSWQSPD
jgi:hypothetical protein